MNKIYKKKQVIDTPKKKKNEKNRVRNVIMNFRVSPREKELIDARIKLTGKTKSEFFIDSCLYQEILVQGNIKTFSEIKEKLAEIAASVNENPNLEDLEPELRESLKMILEIIDRLFGKK
mgnify:CR=1 FL=1